MTILVIGYGNPLRSDDALGCLAAQALAERLDRPDVEVIACHQLTPDLVEPLSRASQAVFIDARDGGQAGEITSEVVCARPSAAAGISHSFCPEALLAFAQALYGTAPAACLFTVSAATFAAGESLSPAVTAQFPRLLEQVESFVLESR